MKEDIELINKFFNNKDSLRKAINRFVIRGNNSIYDINALVYGGVDNFLFNDGTIINNCKKKNYI